MKSFIQGKAAFRLSAGYVLVAVLFFSCCSNAILSGNSKDVDRDKNISLLLMTDVSRELATLSSSLAEEGWSVSQLTQEGFLTSEEYVDLSEFSSLIVYIHKPLDIVVEEALISYAEMGGKLLVLHHALASAKVENPEL